jgi:hypothetical protein
MHYRRKFGSNWGATTFCLKRRLQCFAHSPPGLAPMINNQSTLRTAPNLCKNVSWQYYLVATVVHTQSLSSQICVYIDMFVTLYSQRRWLGKQIQKKLGQQ